jgi:hypothetical protein
LRARRHSRISSMRPKKSCGHSRRGQASCVMLATKQAPASLLFAHCLAIDIQLSMFIDRCAAH